MVSTIALQPNVVGDGVANDAAALLVSDADAVSKGRPLTVVDEDMRIGTNTTLNADYTVERGGRFIPDAGVTLTFTGIIKAGPYQIFAGAGTIAGGFGGTEVRPEWWGAPEDSTTAGDAAVLASIIAAAQAGVLLRGVPGRRYVFANVNNRIGPTLTGAKLFRWTDIEFYSASTTNGPILDIYPDVGAANAVLSANAAVRDHTVTVASDTGLVVGDRYCLIGKASVKTVAAADYKSRKSEYVTVQSKAAGVVTLYNQLRSAYTVADKASLFRATWDWQIDFENITVRRVGGVVSRDGIALTYCNIRGMKNCRGYATGQAAFQFLTCSFSGEVDGSFFDSPSGYGFSVGGCDQPKLGICNGKKMRHVVTMGGEGVSTRSWQLSDGTQVSTTGRDGYCTWVHCDDAENDVFDMHPGHFGFQVGGITGNVRQDASIARGVTIQSPDVSIGIVDVIGGGILVQLYGKGADEAVPFVNFGTVNISADIGSTMNAMTVQNLDETYQRPLRVHASSINGMAGGILNLVTSVAPDDGGDIEMTCDRITGESWFTNPIWLVAGANGKISLTAQRADVQMLSGTATQYVVYATGTAYTTGHAGVPGCNVSIADGNLYRTDPGSATFMARAIDSRIDFGRSVGWSVGAGGSTIGLDLQSGVGGVSGSTKALKTIATNAAFTLTPRTDAEDVKHTGTLTADRALTLATVGSQAGDRFRITRTGGGAFNITHALKNIATNQWAEFRYDGAAWYLAAFGAL